MRVSQTSLSLCPPASVGRDLKGHLVAVSWEYVVTRKMHKDYFTCLTLPRNSPTGHCSGLCQQTPVKTTWEATHKTVTEMGWVPASFRCTRSTDFCKPGTIYFGWGVTLTLDFNNNSLLKPVPLIFVGSLPLPQVLGCWTGVQAYWPRFTKHHCSGLPWISTGFRQWNAFMNLGLHSKKSENLRKLI